MIDEAEQAAYNELTAWALGLGDREFVHQHVVDAWALHHADEDSKAVAVPFTLLGMYLHLEKGYTGKEVQIAHMMLAQPHGRGPGRKQWPHFPLPRDRGKITVIDVMAAPETERKQAIDAWCRSLWEAFVEAHEQFREWVRLELDEGELKRRSAEWDKKFSTRP